LAADDGAKIAWREGEVMDVDEEAVREGRLSARLFGYARVPAERSLVQGPKTAGPSDEDALDGAAVEIASMMEPGTVYFIGPASRSCWPLPRPACLSIPAIPSSIVRLPDSSLCISGRTSAR